MSWITRLFWFFAARYLKGQMVLGAKREGLRVYLKVLQGTRHFLILALIGFCALQIIIVAGFGALVTGLLLLNIETKTVMEILFGVFSALFLVPLAAIAFALSERLWFRVSGAEEMVEELRKKSA